MIKVVFFGSKSYVEDMFNTANKNYNYEFKFYNFNISKDNIELAKGYDVVCTFVNDFVTRDVLVKMKEYGCKLLALRCAGFNAVDMKASKELGIPVVRVPAYSPYAVAEHAFALLSTLNRKLHKAYNRIREANFDINGLLGFDYNGKTIGVIGTGKIGQIAIKIAKGYGMNVLAYDLYPNMDAAKELGFTYASLDEIYNQAHILSLHCPLTPESHHMINKDSLAKMKDNIFIVNTSRGGLINSVDLIDALKSKKLGGVAMDVYENEDEYFFHDLSNSKGVDDDTLARLISFNNVLITAHQAFFTQEALDAISNTTLKNIKSYLELGVLENAVTE